MAEGDVSEDLDVCEALDDAEDDAFGGAAARQPVYTIGYEGRTAAEVLDALLDAGVGTLLDVRELPLSRKAGLSKTALASACEEAGIGYAHERALGNPKAIRKSGGSSSEIIDAFREHLNAALAGDDPLVRAALDAAALLHRTSGPVCLLCFEADPETCHRTVVAERLAGELGVGVEAL